MESSIPIPLVILAAGASRRLGAAKQLVRYQGRTLLARAIATAEATAAGPVLVVLGAGLDQLRAEVAGTTARIVANPAWADGMSTSVRAALVTVTAEIPAAGAILFTVVDQPLVTPDLLADLIAAHRAGHGLVAAAYGGTVGVPALFDRRFFADLTALTGDAGARRVLARHAALVHPVPFPGGLLDLDTAADLDRLASLADRSIDPARG